MQRYYVREIIERKNFNDIPSLISDFKRDTGSNMVLTRNEINHLKFKYTDKYNNLSLLDLVKTIQDENFKIEISSFDAKYKYEFKKNKKIILENREENIIIFGNVENIKNMNLLLIKKYLWIPHSK